MATQVKNMLIGLFIVIGCFLIIGIIMFIKPSVGDGKQIIKVRFSNINGITVGTPVTYAGKPIGEVSHIQQVSDARQQAVNQYGQVYPYVLTLRVDSTYVIFTTDEITVATQGLLGEKYVSIVPHPVKQGQVAHIVTSKDVIYADSNDILESAMNELAALSEKMEEALNRVILWIDKYGDDLGGAIKSFDSTMDGLSIAINEFNNLDVMHDVKNATANIATTFGQLDQTMYQLRQDEFFENLADTMQDLCQISNKVARGKGTLGRIVEEEGLYLQVDAIMTKANTLLNDINQYGLLFQYNKQWQRRRAQLMTEANRLQDPKAFQAYMNKELDSLNTTLNRMTVVTDRFDSKDLTQNADFRHAFIQLMQQLNSLQDQVKLYNQDLFEMRNKCQ